MFGVVNMNTRYGKINISYSVHDQQFSLLVNTFLLKNETRKTCVSMMTAGLSNMHHNKFIKNFSSTSARQEAPKPPLEPAPLDLQQSVKLACEAIQFAMAAKDEAASSQTKFAETISNSVEKFAEAVELVEEFVESDEFIKTELRTAAKIMAIQLTQATELADVAAQLAQKADRNALTLKKLRLAVRVSRSAIKFMMNVVKFDENITEEPVSAEQATTIKPVSVAQPPEAAKPVSEAQSGTISTSDSVTDILLHLVSKPEVPKFLRSLILF